MSSSDPPNPSFSAVHLIPQLDNNHHRRRHPPENSPDIAAPSSAAISREYRKGNWTPQETLILINAKRLDDQRRSRGSSSQCTIAVAEVSSSSSGRSSELRWKWVENYCWKSGCHRSQNQCNDKWDNLLRDYKKVRDHEARFVVSGDTTTTTTKTTVSYWNMEKQERKERGLPSNLSREVFDALADVLTRRTSGRATAAAFSRPPPPPLLLPPPPPEQGREHNVATSPPPPSQSPRLLPPPPDHRQHNAAAPPPPPSVSGTPAIHHMTEAEP